MMTRINICSTSSGYSAHSQKARLKQEQRSATTTALGSRSGSHRVFTAMMGCSRRLLREASVGRSKPKSPPSSSGRNTIGQPSPLVSGAALLQHRLRQCDREHLPAYLWSSNPLNTSLYERPGFEIASTIQVGSSPF